VTVQVGKSVKPRPERGDVSVPSPRSPVLRWKSGGDTSLRYRLSPMSFAKTTKDSASTRRPSSDKVEGKLQSKRQATRA
jgi:hypothetical protein